MILKIVYNQIILLFRLQNNIKKYIISVNSIYLKVNGVYCKFYKGRKSIKKEWADSSLRQDLNEEDRTLLCKALLPLLSATKKPPQRDGTLRSRILPYPASGDLWQDSSLRQSLNEEDRTLLCKALLPLLSATKKPPQRDGFFVAERRGFEPPIPCGILAFQAGTLDHSDISPNGLLPILIYF